MENPVHKRAEAAAAAEKEQANSRNDISFLAEAQQSYDRSTSAWWVDDSLAALVQSLVL